MNVTGRCHCGAIAYEAVVDPERVQICHCTDCQALTGAAYRVSVFAPAESLVMRSGTPKIYVKTAESGNKRAHAFCGDCGSPVYSAAIADPVAYALRVGCLDQRAQLPPKRQIWCRSAVPWSRTLEGVTQVDRQ